MSLKQQLKNCWKQNDKDIMIAYEEINVEQEKFSNDYEKFLLLHFYLSVLSVSTNMSVQVIVLPE